MRDFDQQLERELSAIQQKGLLRQIRSVDSAQSSRIRVEGQELLNFASNDYLGLANHALVKEAAVRAASTYGGGSGAARLMSGSLAPHQQLEETLAAFKGSEAALTFSSGYSAALGAIGAILGRDDVAVIDRLVHASIVDAARLSGAKLRVFAHNDLNELERILQGTITRKAKGNGGGALRPQRVLIVTESVFSMDGDQAPLAAIAELKERYGAWLMVDEAHATGLFGPSRRGLAEAQGVSDRIEIHMGTLGKALGAAGGYICGPRALIDLLINRARSFMFSTAPVPAAVAAATAGIRLVQSESGKELCAQLWRGITEFYDRGSKELLTMFGPPQSAIVPIRLGDETRTLAAAAHLREHGIFVPAIRYPTVARGQARLRVTLTASHTREDIERLAVALAFA